MTRDSIKTVLVAAIAENGIIGRDGDLPWRLSSDLKRFKSLTMGKPIVMGRKTWESLPRRPLPGRVNIVVTRNRDYEADGAHLAASLEDALDVAARNDPDAREVAIIGGSAIFEAALPRADRLVITHVLARIAGDTSFPPIDRESWEAVAEEFCPAGEADSHPTRVVTYERRTTSREGLSKVLSG